MVAEAFDLKEWGFTALVPSVPFALIEPSSGRRLKAGDSLELRKPDGTIAKAILHSLSWPAPSMDGLGLLLKPSITKADVPPGTEVWSI